MLLHACAWLANYLNPVANIIVDTLHQGCRGIFLLADHSHVITRYGLPLVKSLQIDGLLLQISLLDHR